MQPLSDNLQENYDRLIIESLEQGCIWGLRDEEDNWAMVESSVNSDIGVIPFWSNRDLAIALCHDDWAIYKPVAIAIEEFIDDWLTGMHEDVLLVGINWNTDLEGQELEPLDLLEEFESELE
ncbi:MAG: DUF2750 domain-containing protein [Porticoccaceae bacterium]